MSNFKSIAWNDLHDDFKDPEFAYRFGRYEREIEIIKLVEEQPRVLHDGLINANHLVALIKGEK